METWDAIRARRNVRAFEDRPIADGDLSRILEAGRRSPSSMNEQPWDLVVVQGRENLHELARVWQNASHVARSAATIAIVAPRSDRPGKRESIQFDLGQLTIQMALAAADLGIGSGHSAVGDEELAAELLGLPDDRYCAWLLALGHPADRPITPIEHPRRRDFDDVVHWGNWNGSAD